jgi:pseudouridine-5'-phosphate glycosidase
MDNRVDSRGDAPGNAQAERKRAAARAAMLEIPHEGVIGVGTGSTVDFFIAELASIRDRIEGAVSSSEASTAKLAAAGIRVFATGGIGGVHRHWTERPDVSADLAAIARTPTAVISAGAKSILDLPATVEALDSLGVPVIGLGTRAFPRFISPGDDSLGVSAFASNAAEAAAICAAHWAFAPHGGTVIANPPPAEWEIPAHEVETIIAASMLDAAREGIHGAAVTPFLLDRVQRATGGRTVAVNVAVLESNARVGAEVALRMAELR